MITRALSRKSSLTSDIVEASAQYKTQASTTNESFSKKVILFRIVKKQTKIQINK